MLLAVPGYSRSQRACRERLWRPDDGDERDDDAWTSVPGTVRVGIGWFYFTRYKGKSMNSTRNAEIARIEGASGPSVLRKNSR